jgi:hypothetical protein
MMDTTCDNIDAKTISELGLRLSDKKLNAVISPDARVFEYPHLEDVFIMENDLYGHIMPKDFCFLAFYGHHGLIGKDLSIETLQNSTVADIKNMVECNMEG